MLIDGDIMAMYGRRVIYTDEKQIDRRNVVNVLNRAMIAHAANRGEIEYLYNYYRGDQPILHRTKEIRKEINNRIVENRANEIVSFKVGYLMGEPVQYVSRDAKDSADADALNMLNRYMYANGKAALDKELADWFTICGTAYRMVLPAMGEDAEDAPFKIYTLNPKRTFVVYWSGLGNEPVMGVYIVAKQDGNELYCVYTKDRYFEIENGTTILLERSHSMNAVPIIEYPANMSRQGAFETVLPILDALNNIASNRVDGVEQFIQSLLVLTNADITSDQYNEMLKEGGLLLPADGDAKYLTQELNQTQTQTMVDYMYQTVLTICGMPSMSDGGTSDSSNNGAVILKNGWQSAEARAKDTELMFKQSEKRFLKIALSIANIVADNDFNASSIEIRFTRRNYENIQEKAQVLLQMLSSDKIHPRLAFAHCGMFADPEVAYAASVEYEKQQKQEALEEMKRYREQMTASAGDEVSAKADADAESDDESDTKEPFGGDEA